MVVVAAADDDDDNAAFTVPRCSMNMRVFVPNIFLSKIPNIHVCSILHNTIEISPVHSFD